MSNLRDFLGGLDPAVWTDAKAGYLDQNISSRAPSSTALSTATWTNARAGNLDNLDSTVSSRAPSSTALSTATWTNARAAKLDNVDTTVSSRAPSSTALSTNNWTNARAAKLDSIDTTVSSRAPASTALSTNNWTNTRAGYLDTSISSRVSANVWTTTYRNRIDTNISSRLSTCSVQRLATRTRINSNNDYDTWSISSVNTNQTFLTMNASSLGISSYSDGYNSADNYVVATARFIDGSDVRYVISLFYNAVLFGSYISGHSTTPLDASLSSNQAYAEINSVRIY